MGGNYGMVELVPGRDEAGYITAGTWRSVAARDVAAPTVSIRALSKVALELEGR